MNAVTSDIQWQQRSAAQMLAGFGRNINDRAVSGGIIGPVHTRPITREIKSVRCPHCDSIVYSRRSKWCGACCHELPQELLFSEFEARRIENLLDSDRRRHKAWLRRV